MTSSRRPGPAWYAWTWVLVLGGAAALAHQVLWTRRLVDLLGAGPETFSRVVGAFFVGLALGSACSAWFPPGSRGAWRRVVGAEVLIAVAALMTAWGVERLLAGATPEWLLGEGMRRLVPVLMVLPPSWAMGLVLPSMAAAAGRGMEPGRLRAWYAWNTTGGIAGLVAVYFLGLPTLGLRWTTVAACLINLGAAGLAFRVMRRGAGDAEDAVGSAAGKGEGAIDAPAEGVGRFWAWALAFGSGFGVLALEVILHQQFAQVAIHSHASATAVLVMVLAGLALAAPWASKVPRLATVLLVGGVACLLEPWVFLKVQPALSILPYELRPVPYFLRLLGLGVLTAVPIFWAVGLLFPRLMAQHPGGGALGALLAWNGLGGWLGSECAQEILLPRFGLWRSVMGVGVGYVVAAGLAVWFMRTRGAGSVRGRVVDGVGALACCGALWFAWGWSGRQPQVGPSPNERVVDLAVGREGVVAVVVGATNDWRMLMNNTYTLAGSRAQPSQERQGLLPVLVHGRARDVAMLGFATGSTTAGAGLSPEVQTLEAYELSPWVAEMAWRHFGDWNRGVLKDARVRLRTEDARLAIARRTDAFDVVVGDLFLPWRTGEGRLYSSEHFRQVRKALRRDGLFCQWLPMFQLTRPQWETIARTFAREFPSAFLVRGDFYAELPIVGLCAFADGRGLEALDWGAIQKACASVRSGAAQVGDGLMRHPEGVAMCLIGPLPEMGPGPVNKLGNAWLEWDAGRNIVGLQAPWFIGVPWAEWVRERHRDGVPRLPAAYREAHDAGQFFLTLEVAVVSGSRLRAPLEAQMLERLPPALRADRGILWDGWPARIKPRP